MMKKILYGVLFAVLFVGLWNLFDFLFGLIFTGGGYQFTFGSSVLKPLAMSIVVYILLFVINTAGRKNKK